MAAWPLSVVATKRLRGRTVIRDLQSRTGNTAARYAGGFSVSDLGGTSRSSGLVTARSTLVATCA